MAEPLRIAAIILAAGKSSRMGENKMLLELDGEPLVVRAAKRARAAGLSPVVVVVGHERARMERALEGVNCLVEFNPAFDGPSSASMHAGLARLSDEVDAAIVMLGDMVHVTSDMVRAVADAARESDALLVVSKYGDVTAPPICFRRELFPELLAWNGEGCGKPVVRAHMPNARIVEWDSALLADVDTPDDWRSVP